MIKTLVTRYGGKNSAIPDLRFLLTCLLGFAEFLRINELLDVKLKRIKLQETHLEILIPKSKTDHHREGHVMYISRIKSECCLVKYLDAYLQKAKLDISNDKESPLVCRIRKIKSGHKISKKKGFHIPELGKFLKVTYRRLRLYPIILVYTVLDQVVHQLQPITAP